MTGNDQNRNTESGRGAAETGKSAETGDLRSGTTRVNPDAGDMGNAAEDYRNPHGNQSGREPEGGDGSGQSRGDQSAYNPGNSAADIEGNRKSELEGYPVKGSEEAGTARHDQPAEGGSDQQR